MNVINETTKCIPIPQKSPTALREKDKHYSLKQNFFDPTKSSPPNDFMIKLHMRMNSEHCVKKTATA
jgi:hypothetical protein